jgi:hypothetical protein
VTRIGERLRDVRAQEEEHRCREASADPARVYPPIEAQLVDPPTGRRKHAEPARYWFRGVNRRGSARGALMDSEEAASQLIESGPWRPIERTTAVMAPTWT